MDNLAIPDHQRKMAKELWVIWLYLVHFLNPSQRPLQKEHLLLLPVRKEHLNRLRIRGRMSRYTDKLAITGPSQKFATEL